MAEILQENGAGVAIVRFDAQSLNDGLLQLLALVEDPGTKQRCVETARKHFSLDEGVQRYAILYRSMLDRSGSM